MGPLIKITILVFCFCPSIEWRLYSVFCGDIEAVFLLDNEASGKIIANNYRTRQYVGLHTNRSDAEDCFRIFIQQG